MKTEAQLNAKIAALTSEANLIETPLKRINTIKKRLTFIRFCLKYVQANPSEDSLKRQLADCEHQISVYDSRYKDFDARNVKNIRNIRQYYDKINGITKLKEQIKTVNFISSKSNP